MTPQVVELTRLDAPELAPFTSLTEAQAAQPPETLRWGWSIAESTKVILRALDAGCEAVSLLMERRQLESDAGRAVIARCPAARIYTADRALLEKLTGYALTRGFLCAMRRPQPQNADALLAKRAPRSHTGKCDRSYERGRDPALGGCAGAGCGAAHARLLRPAAPARRAREHGRAYSSCPGRASVTGRMRALRRCTRMALSSRRLRCAQTPYPCSTRDLPPSRVLALLLGSEGSGLRSESIALAAPTACASPWRTASIR